MAGIPITPTGLIAAAEWAETRLASFRIRQAPGNRLLLARKLLDQVNKRQLVLRADDPGLLNKVAEAQWTILEQYIITRALGRPGRQLHPKQIRSLEGMLSGAETEEQDGNPLGRNTQFELYVAATLLMGDVPAQLGEPDVRAEYLGQEIGIAAKRVRSMNKVVERVKEAVKQIKASGTPGMVAVNADVLVKQVAPDVANNDDLTNRVAELSKIDEVLEPCGEVVGCLIFARDVVWDFSAAKPRISFASTHSFRAYPRNDQQETGAKTFWESARKRIDKRLENL